MAKKKTYFARQENKIMQKSNASNIIFYLVIIFMSAGVWWAYETKLDEIIRAEAIIEPEGKIQTIQSRFGGTVEKINVKVGDTVPKNTTLITLNSKEAEASLLQNQATLSNLNGEIDRLTSEVNGLDTIEWRNQTTPDTKLTQQRLFEAKKEKLVRQDNVLAEEILGLQNRILEAQQTIFGLQQQKKSKEDEEQIYIPLVKRGIEPRIRLQNIQTQILDLKNSIQLQNIKKKGFEIEIQTLKTKRLELRASYQEQSYSELADKIGELKRVKTQTEALTLRVSSNEIKASEEGVITKVYPTGIGSVYSPGEPLVELAPLSEKLQVVARLKPQDVTSVRIGQPARVSLASYDFTTYGTLSAVVTKVAQNTTASDDGSLYYPIWVETTSKKLDKSGILPDIIPGMLAQVEIIGEERSIVDYLLKPIREISSKALTER